MQYEQRFSVPDNCASGSRLTRILLGKEGIKPYDFFRSKKASIGQCVKQTSTTQVHQKRSVFLIFWKK